MNTEYREGIVLPVVLEYADTSVYGNRGELSHWHDAIELVCVTRGRLRCQTNRDTFLLGKGDLCFINQHQVHRLVKADNEEGDGLTLVINTSALLQNQELHDAYVKPVLEDPMFGHLLLQGHTAQAARIRALVEDVELLLRERPLAFELELVASCYMIFRELYCTLAEHGDDAEPADENLALLKHMINFIRQHHAENLQLDDIAEAGGVSKSTCSRVFKRYTGRSPVSYLIDYRLEVGAVLLRSTSDSVAAIAQACGFTQQSYFNRMFLRAFGVTPLAYRKEGLAVPEAS